MSIQVWVLPYNAIAQKPHQKQSLLTYFDALRGARLCCIKYIQKKHTTIGLCVQKIIVELLKIFYHKKSLECVMRIVLTFYFLLKLMLSSAAPRMVNNTMAITEMKNNLSRRPGVLMCVSLKPIPDR